MEEGRKLIIDQPDFRVYDYEFDPERKHWYCHCEELINGKWEAFISIRKTNPNKKQSKTKIK